MKSKIYLKILFLSVGVAIVLSAFSLFCMMKIGEIAAQDRRQDFMRFLAEMLEAEPLNKDSLLILRPGGPRDFDRGHRPPPPNFNGEEGPPDFEHRPPGLPPPPTMGGPMGGPPMLGPHGRPSLWIVDDKGNILSTDAEIPLPETFSKMILPKEVHQVYSKTSFMSLSGGLYVMKLQASEPRYLVLQEGERPPQSPLLIIQALLTFATVSVALLLAVFLSLFYFRRKSEEARIVLRKLEGGDLKARFEIKRFDEFSGLPLDFNRMAEEIERLVHRVHQAEATRKNLLQELGHDLRTPLTSLTTSFETLKFHAEKLTPEENRELLDMASAEIEYFKELLENLMTIARIDQPQYGEAKQNLDLKSFLLHEIKSRESSSELKWDLKIMGEEPFEIRGEAHAIRRLLKNAYDNATRYAKHEVQTSIRRREGRIEIVIQDDGSGLSREALDSFGKRQEKRTIREGSGTNFSLGLGSVIMKTIVELHGGTLEIRNRAGASGAELVILMGDVQSQ